MSKFMKISGFSLLMGLSALTMQVKNVAKENPDSNMTEIIKKSYDDTAIPLSLVGLGVLGIASAGVGNVVKTLKDIKPTKQIK